MTISIPNSRRVSMTDSSGNIFELITGADVYQPLLETAVGVNVFFKAYEDLGMPENFKVADFGTGTGQFGVMIKDKYPQTDVTVYDNDPAAEKYILANAELHNVDIAVNIMDVADIADSEEFDAVISTPPYLPEILKKLTFTGSHSEDPDNAIFGGFKGLEVAAVFIDKASKVLKSGGYIVQTHSFMQLEDITTLLTDGGFSNLETFRLNPSSPGDIEEAVFTIAFKN